jgi:sugar phosphate isomerase/epimerase
MRLGGPVFRACPDPDAWLAEVRRLGWRATLCPLQPGADAATISSFSTAAQHAELVIAEVGAWSNPIANDPAERAAAIAYCQASLQLAEDIGARCCVNLAGSRGTRRNQAHPGNLSPATFELVVASVREIIDAVRPRRSSYALEAMPWLLPDSAEVYLELVRAIDRPGFGVHFDPVNLLNSPRRCFQHRELISDFIARLGPWIRSCHAKDAILRDSPPVCISETRPGQGLLDYPHLLCELDRLGPDMPLILEHLPDEAGYVAAADYIRSLT